MLNYKPISVERARVKYFQAVNEVRFAVGQMERDRARTEQRKSEKVLQHAQRIERGRKESMGRARRRRRMDWNIAV